MRTGPHNNRIICVAVKIAMLLLPIVAVFGCGEEEKPPEVIRSIRWIKVTSTDAEQVRPISGVIKPIDESKLSFAVGGTVEIVKVSLGDRVKKNVVLAVLDKQPFELEVRNAEAALKDSEATLIERRANYERIRDLYASNNVSKAEFDTARASFKSAESQVKAAGAQLGLARRDLEKAVLRAPYNGVISIKEIEPHEEVTSGQAIFGIDGEESGFEISLGIPETLISKVEKGQRVNVVFPSINRRCECGLVSEVGTKAQTANLFPVTVKLLEHYPEMRAGMSVEVAFRFETELPEGSVEKTYTIPLTAILTEKGKERSVFVYNSQTSTVTKKAITTINVRENDVIVSGDLHDGDTIATAGVQFLSDGQKVELAQGEAR